MKKIIFGISILAISNFVVAYVREAETCLPISTVTYEAGNKSIEGLSEADYNQILDQVQTIMGPEIKRVLNKNLIIDRKWEDATVDAFATRDDANNSVIVMNGGLARHPLMTKDAFLLLACHEVGHHLGGAPKILRGNSGLKSWSSAEGEADYYATTKCLPLFFKAGIENKKFDIDSDANNLKLALSKCHDNVCARIVLSGLTVSRVFASVLQGATEPSLLKNDQTKVEKTIYDHPNPQCRLDTYLSGANCDVGVNVPFDNNDPRVGACSKDQGARPMCWYREKDFISN